MRGSWPTISSLARTGVGRLGEDVDRESEVNWERYRSKEGMFAEIEGRGFAGGPGRSLESDGIIMTFFELHRSEPAGAASVMASFGAAYIVSEHDVDLDRSSRRVGAPTATGPAQMIHEARRLPSMGACECLREESILLLRSGSYRLARSITWRG